MGGNVRTREVRGKPGKFRATQASTTGNLKKLGCEECWQPVIHKE